MIKKKKLKKVKKLSIDEQIKAVAAKLRKEAGIEDLENRLKEISQKRVPMLTAKMKHILGDVDLTKKDTLSKEQKIVGFYHALVTRDEVVLKALTEGTPGDGGYLFPDEFKAELIQAMDEEWNLRSLVRTVPMRRDVMKIPKTVSNPKVYWTSEGATKTTTSAEFTEVTLTAYKLAAIIYATDELVEDSDQFDVVKLIIDLFARRISEEYDKAIAQGSGVGEPTGLVTARAADNIASIACDGNLDFDDIINLVYLLPKQYRANASFLVANANIKELRKLKDDNNRYLWQESAQAGEPAKILGYPVHEVNYVGEGNIFFGDWKKCYWFGMRKEMAIKVSQDTETAFTEDKTAIRVVSRVAGNVVLGAAARALITIP